MPQELINILIQLPVVALFLWYSERMYNRFEAFLKEERAAREKQTEKTAEILDEISGKISAYHAEVKNGIDVMRERTGQNQNQNKSTRSAE